jgi:hypothetical protein
MPPTRRDALLAVAGSLSFALSGCLSRVASDGARAYDRTTGPYERGPRQGRGDPLTLGETVVVDDPDLELASGGDAVRFPSLMNESGVVATDTMPFDRWSQLQCAEAALDPAWRVVERRLDGESERLGRGVTSSFPGMVVEFSHTTTVDDEGEVVSAPPVTFDDLLDITPRSVTATVSLDEKTVTHTVPVQVIGVRTPEGEEFDLDLEGQSATEVTSANETARAGGSGPGEQTVRGRAPVVTAENPAVVHHSGVSFDDREMTLRSWAEDECLDVALDAARAVVGERLEEASGVVWGTTAAGIEVELGRAVDRNGTVVSEPTHSVEVLLEATPRAIRVPVRFSGDNEELTGREETFTVPVRVATRVSEASWT